MKRKGKGRPRHPIDDMLHIRVNGCVIAGSVKKQLTIVIGTAGNIHLWSTWSLLQFYKGLLLLAIEWCEECRAEKEGLRKSPYTHDSEMLMQGNTPALHQGHTIDQDSEPAILG